QEEDLRHTKSFPECLRHPEAHLPIASLPELPYDASAAPGCCALLMAPAILAGDNQPYAVPSLAGLTAVRSTRQGGGVGCLSCSEERAQHDQTGLSRQCHRAGSPLAGRLYLPHYWCGDPPGPTWQLS